MTGWTSPLDLNFWYTRYAVLIATFKFLAILENGKSIPMRRYTIRHLRSPWIRSFSHRFCWHHSSFLLFPCYSACTRVLIHSRKFCESSLNPVMQRKIWTQLKSAVFSKFTPMGYYFQCIRLGPHVRDLA